MLQTRDQQWSYNMDKNEAMQVIQQEKQEREEAVMQELQELLQKYNCELSLITIIVNGQVQQKIEVSAK